MCSCGAHLLIMVKPPFAHRTITEAEDELLIALASSYLRLRVLDLHSSTRFHRWLKTLAWALVLCCLLH